MPYELADNEGLRQLLGGPDPRLFEAAAAGDVAKLQALLKVRVRVCLAMQQGGWGTWPQSPGHGAGDGCRANVAAG